ncbi:MAG: transcriptional repressor [Gammaproteobacteria bacterium]|nr:transcriptional repressor [Gammaproteobacteria bacterium]
MGKPLEHVPHDHATPHDHAACIDQAVRTAADVCAQRGLKLTPVRRRFVALLGELGEDVVGADRRMCAPDDLENAAPPTVYRALEFLIDAGLVHRIDSINAFIGCDEPARAHVAQFLVCRKCHRVVEIDDPGINRLLAEKSLAAGFRIEPTSLEIKGLCGECEDA